MTDERPVVTWAPDGDVAVVTIDHPPVNALSAAVRAGLLTAIGEIEADPGIRATVIACVGRTFVAGADVREFGKPPVEPALPKVLDAIENATKPVVAAIHGTALGGGFELALVCHARVARADARVGLPEIRLGVIPGAGGTQRLPRLVGVAAALDAILSGASIEAPRAAKLGAIDEIVPADGALVAAAIARARSMATARAPLVRTRDRVVPTEGLAEAIATRRAALLETDPDEIAGLAAIEAVRIGLEQGFEAGLAAERRAFLELRDGARAAAKREAFFAARRKPAS